MQKAEDDRKVELVRELVFRGHGEDIRQILLGVSKHSKASTNSEQMYPDEFENRDSKGFHLMTWVQAHLEFTARFGCTATEAREGKFVYFAHHYEYEEWLRHGAPGILLEELESLTNDSSFSE